MTLEDQIASLLAEAEPLRALAEDDPAKVPLAGIVDAINALRARQANEPAAAPAPVADPEPAAEIVKRDPGRPKKAD